MKVKAKPDPTVLPKGKTQAKPDPIILPKGKTQANITINGPCETNVAREFSMNALQVENILVTGHSCCGIRALMSMDDEDNSRQQDQAQRPPLLTSALTSSANTKKESINNSLLNMLSAFVSEDDEETRACKSLFQNKMFFFGREVPWSNERSLENKELNAIIGAWFTLWRD
ncbi:beta carbonic anhydrase 5, chloroplastic isoform X2 [Tanacetum coccineum]